MKQVKIFFLCITIAFMAISSGFAQGKNPPPPRPYPIDLKEGKGFLYRISWQNKPAGYSKFYLQKKLSLAGEYFYNFVSLSRLKIGLGQIDDLAFSAEITVKNGSFLPTYLHAKQKVSGIEASVDLLVSSNLIAQKNYTINGVTDVYQELSPKTPPYILMNNLWGKIDTLPEHYYFLLKSGRTGKIPVYDPILQFRGEVELRPVGQEDIKIEGKTIKAVKFELYDFFGVHSLNLWTDGERDILKIEQQGGGLTFERYDESVVENFDKIKGVDMWKERVATSNIFFPNPQSIDSLTMDVTLRGVNVNPQNVEYPGFSQVFEGGAENGEYKGQIIVKTKNVALKSPLKFPVTDKLPENVETFVAPSIGIESSDDNVKNRAIGVAWKSADVWEGAKKINKWVFENIPVGVSLPSAKMTLANEQGNSESKALLAIAMCRSIGIPARKAGGIVFSGGNFIPHYWLEVYTGDDGWIPLDPSTGESDRLSATHVRLFDSGEVMAMTTNVKEFAPLPPRQVTYINREITWPVGEERVYVLKKDGKPCGEEVAWMAQTAIKDDQEAYEMKITSSLSIEETKTETQSTCDLWLNPQGLPIYYENNVKSGALEEKEILRQEGQSIFQELSGYRGEVKREIPYSNGAYLVDTYYLSLWALIGGQFPDVKLGKEYTFYVFIPEQFTIEKINAQVKKFESVETGQSIVEAFRLETNKGILLWVEAKTGKVVKISFQSQGVELELQSSRFRLN